MKTATVELEHNAVVFRSSCGVRLPVGFSAFGWRCGRRYEFVAVKSEDGDAAPMLVACDWLRDREWEITGVGEWCANAIKTSLAI